MQGSRSTLGNFGVTTMQILIPTVMTIGIFGAIAGDPIALIRDSGTLIGRIEAGTPTYIQNAGFIWAAILIPLVTIAWFGMNNLKPLSPDMTGTLSSFGKILGLYGVGLLTSVIGLCFFLPAPSGLGILNVFVAVVLICVLTLVLLRMIPGRVGASMGTQFAIFKDKHTWSMTILYILTFGSFIGYSMALPLGITVIFGFTNVEVDGVMERVAKGRMWSSHKRTCAA